MYIVDRQLADLYILAQDIIVNFWQQRDGYHSEFYYTFNNKLDFALCKGSDLEQFKLLQQLSDRGTLEFKEQPIPADMPSDFVSNNAQKRPDGRMFYLILKPNALSDEFEKLKPYAPSRNTDDATPLSEVIAEITDQFSIHDNDIISYVGRVIDLQPQERKIAALIMKTSLAKQYTTLETIIDDCLDEHYLEKIEAKEGAAANRVRRTVSELRKKFRIATQSNEGKNFFPNKHDTGYIFKP